MKRNLQMMENKMPVASEFLQKCLTRMKVELTTKDAFPEFIH